MLVNELDIAFIIDTTGSMGSFLDSAKRCMVGILQELVAKLDVDARVCLVEYRDHEPQERTFAAKLHQFADLSEMQQIIDKLSIGGGGDEPESVLDGIIMACDEAQWRPHARKLGILIGDAPPHGYFSGVDAWPNGCPCGKTMRGATMALEEEEITLHSIGLTRHVKPSFTELSNLSGGQYFSSISGVSAIDEVRNLLEREFRDIEFDRDVLSVWQDGMHNKHDIAARLQCSLQDVLGSIGRLNARKLLCQAEVLV